MIEWYNSLEPLLKTFWGIAIFFSLFFLIQNIMTLVGLGHSDAAGIDGMDGLDGLDGVDGLDGADAMDGADGNTLDTGGAMQLFTIRNLVNFMLGIGWGGVCFYQYVPNHLLLCLIALVCGIAFLVLFFVLWRKMLHLEKHGNLRIQDAVGKVCDVYLRIPANRGGKGKVQISFGGSIQELAALTDSDEQIPSGAKVRILQLVDGNTLLVEKI